MSNQRNQRAQKVVNPNRLFQKFFLSAFVVLSFIAYALQKPFGNPDSGANSLSSDPNGLVSQLYTTPTSPDPAVTTEVLPQDATPTAPSQDVAAGILKATPTTIIPLPTVTPSVRLAANL